jgi:hypothetical protein
MKLTFTREKIEHILPRTIFNDVLKGSFVRGQIKGSSNEKEHYILLKVKDVREGKDEYPLN